uniref:Uncharacterized protein n=1 Tax=Alexandrium catenella TaxID=2925 RepID=A0A7S1SB92_ALECA
MAATSLLRCPRAFAESHPRGRDCSAAMMAWEYLDFAERFPPPSPLYIRKHLRWLFRADLQHSYTAAHARWLEGKDLDAADWHARAWTFLEQPYLTEVWQFRELVRFIASRQGVQLGGQLDGRPILSLRDIRRGRCAEEDGTHIDLDWSLDFG